MRSFLLLCLINLSVTACSNMAVTPESTGNLPQLFDRRAGDVALRDEQVEIKARTELAQQEIQQSHINVNVFNGKMLLTGEAPTEELHQAMVEQLRVIPGVAQVYDEIDIAGVADYSSRDADSSTSNRVRTELDKITTPPGFSSNNIKVVTETGVVYLLGLVYRDEADVAASVTQQVPGVLQIVKLFEYFK